MYDKVKIATQVDADLIFSLAKKFVLETAYSGLENDTKIKLIIDMVLSNPKQNIVLLYEDKGIIAGTVQPFIYGMDLVATELCWWVEPEYRNSDIGNILREGFEFWAKKVGCRFVLMTSISDKLDNYFKEVGYSLKERSFMKEI